MACNRAGINQIPAFFARAAGYYPVHRQDFGSAQVQLCHGWGANSRHNYRLLAALLVQLL